MQNGTISTTRDKKMREQNLKTSSKPSHDLNSRTIYMFLQFLCIYCFSKSFDKEEIKIENPNDNRLETIEDAQQKIVAPMYNSYF